MVSEKEEGRRRRRKKKKKKNLSFTWYGMQVVVFVVVMSGVMR